MDDGKSHRPSSIVRLFISILLNISLVACGTSRRTVKLAILGDINLGRDVNAAADSFSLLAPDLAWADLTLANLESPLSADPQVSNSGYNLCALDKSASLLSGWSFDLLSIANNHDLDCGPDGASGTRLALEAAGITPMGPGMEPVYRNVNGLQLAFLAFDDVTSRLDTEAAARTIHSTSESGAQVIVSIHWGMEYQSGSSDRQELLAQQFSQAGAILVWGHHPHVLQPAEWIESTHGKTMVLYSLGNALFDQAGLADTRRSALLLVEVNSSGVQSIRAVPFIIDVVHSRLTAADVETAGKILDELKIK